MLLYMLYMSIIIINKITFWNFVEATYSNCNWYFYIPMIYKLANDVYN